jgi:hypothetical protein
MTGWLKRAPAVLAASLIFFGTTRAVSALPRAYLLIEIDPSKPNIVQQLGSLSLSNCKLLAEMIYPGEVVAHLECNELPDVSRAVLERISQVEGVRRTTMVAIVNAP